MLQNLLRRRRAPAPQRAIPDGQRVYAVGDIHGRLDLLDNLLDSIAADDARRPPAETSLIFLGDLVDRGPSSAQVVERLRLLSQGSMRARFIAGNHEEVFLATLEGDSRAARLFCRIGGRETALSYGISEVAYDRADYDELLALLVRHVPPEHRAFLSSFEEMVTVGDYLFVHAGVDPGKPLHDQETSSLRWIREPFLTYDGPFLDKLIVHGHTVAEAVSCGPHRIGIDTGAYASGRLSAVGLEGAESWFLQT